MLFRFLILKAARHTPGPYVAPSTASVTVSCRHQPTTQQYVHHLLRHLIRAARPAHSPTNVRKTPNVMAGMMASLETASGGAGLAHGIQRHTLALGRVNCFGLSSTTLCPIPLARHARVRNAHEIGEQTGPGGVYLSRTRIHSYKVHRPLSPLAITKPHFFHPRNAALLANRFLANLHPP